MAMLICVALSLGNTPKIMATLCSIKAKGQDIALVTQGNLTWQFHTNPTFIVGAYRINIRSGTSSFPSNSVKKKPT